MSRVQLLFVYGSLKERPIQVKVLGKKESMSRAILPRYSEKILVRHDGDWPTVEETGGAQSYVRGDVFRVSQEDLDKLDNWEDRYDRREVATSAGRAYVYVYRDDQST